MGSLYDEFENEFFLKKLQEFDRLLWFFARRYTIPGVLRPEDLYQEGCQALMETIEEDWQHHPDSEAFTRAFKSRLGHKMSHCLRYHKQGCRDWRKEIHDTIREYDDGEVESLLDRLPSDTYPAPDEEIEKRDIDMFMKAVRARLKELADKGSMYGSCADDALEVLDIVLNPILPDNICQLYERIPGHLSNALLAEITDWDIMKVRRAKKKLRETAEKLAPEYGIQLRRRK